MDPWRHAAARAVICPPPGPFGARPQAVGVSLGALRPSNAEERHGRGSPCSESSSGQPHYPASPLDIPGPADPAVHLVRDHYATHKPPIQRWLARPLRFTLHGISTGLSWANLVSDGSRS